MCFFVFRHMHGAVSYETPVGGIQVFADHTLRNKHKQNASTIFARCAAFYACLLHAQTQVMPVYADDIRNLRITVILIVGKPRIPPIGAQC